MVDIKGALKHIESNIEKLEKEIYNFETVALKRYAEDKKIIAQMRSDAIKLEALTKKHAKGEDITAEDIADAVPAAFR
jgi:hypothetical protein